jgi:hypothetical protein
MWKKCEVPWARPIRPMVVASWRASGDEGAGERVVAVMVGDCTPGRRPARGAA